MYIYKRHVLVRVCASTLVRMSARETPRSAPTCVHPLTETRFPPNNACLHMQLHTAQAISLGRLPLERWSPRANTTKGQCIGHCRSNHPLLVPQGQYIGHYSNNQHRHIQARQGQTRYPKS